MMRSPSSKRGFASFSSENSRWRQLLQPVCVRMVPPELRHHTFILALVIVQDTKSIDEPLEHPQILLSIQITPGRPEVLVLGN